MYKNTPDVDLAVIVNLFNWLNATKDVGDTAAHMMFSENSWGYHIHS